MYSPLQSEFLLVLDGTIIIDCCEARRRQFAAEGWHIDVLAYAENMPKMGRHCRVKPCVSHGRGAANGKT